MQFISTKYHALLDYVIGAILICTPWLFYTWDNSLSKWTLIFAGIGLIFNSLITRHEYSLIKLIPMRFHLTLDMIVALILIGSPWVFNFYDSMMVPHIAFGLMEIGIVIFSSPKRVHQLYTGKSYKY